MRFTDDLKKRVAKAQKKIVLPETNSRRVLKAAERVLADGFAKIVLVGKLEQIKKDAAKFQIDLTGVEVINPETYYRMDELCDYFAKRREKKGMTPEKARDIMTPSSVAEIAEESMTLREFYQNDAFRQFSRIPVYNEEATLPALFERLSWRKRIATETTTMVEMTSVAFMSSVR